MTVRLLRPFAAIVMVSIFFAASARAAEIGCGSFWGETRLPGEKAQRLWPSGARPTPDTCKIGFMQGDIVKGDYEKLLTLFRKNHPFLWQVSLDSPGGDVDEAMNIGRLFRKYLITAVSRFQMTIGDRSIQMNYRTGSFESCGDRDCICASSCALIWFGAPDRSGRIGLHRPRTENPAFKALAPPEAARAYRRMLDGIVRYLEEMETPRPLIDAMVSTGSAEIRWFDVETSGDRAPSFAEWADASCGQLTIEDKDKMIKLDVKRTFEKLTQTEESLHRLLREKYSKKTDCEIELISSQRDRLPLP